VNVDLIVIGASVVVFAALVGYLVRALLVARQQRLQRFDEDELLARVAEKTGGLSASLRTRGFLRQVREQLPDALDLIANSLTAGLTLPQALLRNFDHFPPAVQTEFARVIYDTRLGFSVADAFDRFATRLALNDLKLVATASRIGVEHGGNLAESYRMLSSMLRDNLAFETELRAMTTEGRMQALVMSLLPFGLILILLVVNPPLMLPLVTTLAGWCVIGVLCLMLGIAYLWIRSLVDIRV